MRFEVNVVYSTERTEHTERTERTEHTERTERTVLTELTEHITAVISFCTGVVVWCINCLRV